MTVSLAITLLPRKSSISVRLLRPCSLTAHSPSRQRHGLAHPVQDQRRHLAPHRQARFLIARRIGLSLPVHTLSRRWASFSDAAGRITFLTRASTLLLACTAQTCTRAEAQRTSDTRKSNAQRRLVQTRISVQLETAVSAGTAQARRTSCHRGSAQISRATRRRSHLVIRQPNIVLEDGVPLLQDDLAVSEAVPSSAPSRASCLSELR